jgi:hypothetical protein
MIIFQNIYGSFAENLYVPVTWGATLHNGDEKQRELWKIAFLGGSEKITSNSEYAAHNKSHKGF